MKDPCLECLVRVTCWQECDKLSNHGVLLGQALKNFSGVFHQHNKTYQKQYRHFLDLSQQLSLRRSQINKRARLMSEDN